MANGLCLQAVFPVPTVCLLRYYTALIHFNLILIYLLDSQNEDLFVQIIINALLLS